ncbi:MAG: cytochrome c [Bacteroidia bacterium]
MKTLIKIFKRLGVLLLILLVLFIAFVQLTWDKKFEATLPDIKASTDPAVIERGKHLAFGPAHCSTCHVPMDKMEAVEGGLFLPLSGGWELEIPPGTFRAPNLTPDMETGIGKMTDGQIARSLRYSVSRYESCVFPFMPFQELSDEDLTAIISFLRSQPAVTHKLERSSLTFLGKMLMALGAVKPEGPKHTPPKHVDIDTTITYGSYLANSVANCVGCHTKRDFKTGEFVGQPFAGGTVFAPDKFTMGKAFVTPNLTPSKTTGVIVDWSEETFIQRFRKGRLFKGSPMPWGTFSRMTDLELKAIYRYLQTLAPVENKIPRTLYNEGEELPE